MLFLFTGTQRLIANIDAPSYYGVLYASLTMLFMPFDRLLAALVLMTYEAMICGILAHLSQRLIGELIYSIPMVRRPSVVVHNFEN